MDVQAEKLKALRDTLGLTQHSIARSIGVSESSIQNFENSTRQPNGHSKVRQKILDFIDANPIQPGENLDWVEQDISEALEIERKKKRFYRHFIKGRAYSISKLSKSNAGDNAKEIENECVFVYVGKQGIHHMFREAKGGWSRTYTDAQLVDKKVLEVRS